MRNRHRPALALVVPNTLPLQIELMKKGHSAGQVGQRPFEMGYKAISVLKDSTRDAGMRRRR